MCTACIASTTVLPAGAGSAAGILTAWIGRFRNDFRASSFGRRPKFPQV